MNKVSIAMTTYNGEKFLEQQLLSIFEQTRQPDEVVICDDGSTDNTVKVVQQFITKHNVQDNWKIIENEQNKGFTKNFLECASVTTGDIIFFSDQDDIWAKNKICKMLALFEHDEKIKAIACDFTYIDKEGNKLEFISTKFQKDKTYVQKIPFYKQVRYNKSPGFALAVRREVLNYTKPIIFDYNLTFDLPMGLLMSASGGYYLLGEVLVHHRIHSENISTPKYTLKSRIQNIDFQISGRRQRLELIKACSEVLDDVLTDRDKKNLHKAIESSTKSIINLQKRRVIPLFFDIFSLNPMNNHLIAVTILICAVFGDYSKVNSG